MCDLSTLDVIFHFKVPPKSRIHDREFPIWKKLSLSLVRPIFKSRQKLKVQIGALTLTNEFSRNSGTYVIVLRIFLVQIVEFAGLRLWLIFGGTGTMLWLLRSWCWLVSDLLRLRNVLDLKSIKNYHSEFRMKSDTHWLRLLLQIFTN